MNINITAKHIENPFVTRWILRRLDRISEFDPVKAEKIKELFNDISIAKLIEQNDSEVLTSLFRILPAQRFAKLVSVLCEKWPSWNDTVACWSAPIIAELDADSFLYLFKSTKYTDFNSVNSPAKRDFVLP